MIVVTAGNKYLDIDAYASAIAYVHLLKEKGENAVFATSVKPNASVCKVIKELGFNPEYNYVTNTEDEFVVLDLSNPDFVDKLVDKKNIIEVIDHHTGFEDYWKEKKIKNQIEFIGSVATMIYERFVQENKTNIINKDMCKLLIAAILDNTLNLKADVTTQRDIDAYQQLQKIGGLDENFDREYLRSCQETINDNMEQAILDDIKEENTKGVLPDIIGQLVVYEKEPVLNKMNNIEKLFERFSQPWFINLVCLKDGKSYLISRNSEAKEKIEGLFNEKFEGDILTLQKFKLRKEIIKIARSRV